MASNSTKSFLADAGYGEQELDANSALMELDKGLRSGKLGEQCEAVVRFPRLFQKYPFPILINSAFLKLADVFRVGNNFLRLCVLKVTQQSEKHLEKILNVDEFVKRIFSVIHSNDPVARAITLRMLGSLASIIPERKNAHHSIRQSLDSHDNVEVEAAVFAAANFSAQSKDFAVGICNKISEMIQGLATPVDLKLKLIPILQHMHHDAILASSARQLLQQLVTAYPSTKMVIVSLHTFTLLAASSLVDTPKQIQLLLQYLKNDPRKAVKRLAIQDLKLLANKTPHTWSKDNIQIALNCMVKLAKGRPHLSQSVVETLLTQLHSAQDAARILMCHCLAAIAMQLPVLGDGMLGDLMELYKVIGRSATDKQQELLVSLATVIFVASQKALSAEVKAIIKQQLESVSNGWTVYRIARQASRMGNHDMARELYQSLLTQVASEHFYFWLNSLKEFSHAEQCLTGLQEENYSSALSCIAESLKFYHKGIASLTMKQSMEEFRSLASRYGDLYQASFDADSATLRNVELYFFQKLQSTSIKLALSPSPRNPAEPIAVQNNQQLALKVEGVVQHGSKPGLFRKIQSVCLNVSSTLQSKSGQDYKIPIDNMTNEMEQRVEPHNDYFSTQFLLNFAILGTHNITVESSVKDANGIVWKTGPRTTIFVKSLEDPYSQQIRLQQQQAQQPLQQQQQRNAYTRF
ncbi:Integrator complex subunit 7 [Tupaia chinensis]|uniref:Integrator complex subunit 7 n=1 Tax=Tupaia chinensis TaxID=246437 RepID=L8Y9L7_TUPCH|nr:Integrator complex subunit 7 [Tupaia chinensis]